MSATNPYEQPGDRTSDVTLGARDHLICCVLAGMMWVSSAAVMGAFAFGIYVALHGPYRPGDTALADDAAVSGRSAAGWIAAGILVIASCLAAFTFYRVQQSRRRTGASQRRREELARVVQELKADVRRSRARGPADGSEDTPAGSPGQPSDNRPARSPERSNSDASQ